MKGGGVAGEPGGEAGRELRRHREEPEAARGDGDRGQAAGRGRPDHRQPLHGRHQDLGNAHITDSNTF